MTSTLKAVRPACSCCSTVGVCDLCHLVHFLRSALKWVIMMDVIPSQHFIIYMLAVFVEFIITSRHCAWSSLVLMAACIHIHWFIHHSTEHKLMVRSIWSQKLESPSSQSDMWSRTPLEVEVPTLKLRGTSVNPRLKFNMAALCVNNQKAAHYTVF